MDSLAPPGRRDLRGPRAQRLTALGALFAARGDCSRKNITGIPGTAAFDAQRQRHFFGGSILEVDASLMTLSNCGPLQAADPVPGGGGQNGFKRLSLVDNDPRNDQTLAEWETFVKDNALFRCANDASYPMWWYGPRNTDKCILNVLKHPTTDSLKKLMESPTASIWSPMCEKDTGWFGTCKVDGKDLEDDNKPKTFVLKCDVDGCSFGEEAKEQAKDQAARMKRYKFATLSMCHQEVQRQIEDQGSTFKKLQDTKVTFSIRLKMDEPSVVKVQDSMPDQVSDELYGFNCECAWVKSKETKEQKSLENVGKCIKRAKESVPPLQQVLYVCVKKAVQDPPRGACVAFLPKRDEQGKIQPGKTATKYFNAATDSWFVPNGGGLAVTTREGQNRKYYNVLKETCDEKLKNLAADCGRKDHVKGSWETGFRVEPGAKPGAAATAGDGPLDVPKDYIRELPVDLTLRGKCANLKMKVTELELVSLKTCHDAFMDCNRKVPEERNTCITALKTLGAGFIDERGVHGILIAKEHFFADNDASKGFWMQWQIEPWLVLEKLKHQTPEDKIFAALPDGRAGVIFVMVLCVIAFFSSCSGVYVWAMSKPWGQEVPPPPPAKTADRPKPPRKRSETDQVLDLLADVKKMTDIKKKKSVMSKKSRHPQTGRRRSLSYSPPRMRSRSHSRSEDSFEDRPQRRPHSSDGLRSRRDPFRSRRDASRSPSPEFGHTRSRRRLHSHSRTPSDDRGSRRSTPPQKSMRSRRDVPGKSMRSERRFQEENTVARDKFDDIWRDDEEEQFAAPARSVKSKAAGWEEMAPKLRSMASHAATQAMGTFRSMAGSLTGAEDRVDFPRSTKKSVTVRGFEEGTMRSGRPGLGTRGVPTGTRGVPLGTRGTRGTRGGRGGERSLTPPRGERSPPRGERSLTPPRGERSMTPQRSGFADPDADIAASSRSLRGGGRDERGSPRDFGVDREPLDIERGRDGSLRGGGRDGSLRGGGRDRDRDWALEASRGGGSFRDDARDHGPGSVGVRDSGSPEDSFRGGSVRGGSDRGPRPEGGGSQRQSPSRGSGGGGRSPPGSTRRSPSPGSPGGSGSGGSGGGSRSPSPPPFGVPTKSVKSTKLSRMKAKSKKR